MTREPRPPVDPPLVAIGPSAKLEDLRIDMALVKRDIDSVQSDIGEIKQTLAEIRSYFIKVVLGAGALVGAAVIKWILSGGLTGG